jgi:hypothetical protein
MNELEDYLVANMFNDIVDGEDEGNS